MSLDHFIPDTLFGKVELCQVGLGQLNANRKDELFERKVQYYNFLSKPVTVLERNGMQWEFPAIPDVQRASFVVQTEWKVHKDLHREFFAWIKIVRENESKLIRDLREIAARHQPTVYEQYLLFRTERLLSLDDLERHRGEIYDHDHDVVVSLYRGLESGPHPFSEMGRALALLNENATRNDEEAFSETIKIVDNTGQFGDRFINRNGNIYRIQSAQDPTREEGVWVIRNKPFENTRLPSTVGWRRYTLQESDELLDLYKTYAEAEHCGDGETKRKQELLAQEERLIRARNELNEQKLAHQKAQHEWELEKTKLQREFERQQAAFAEEAFRAKMELDRMKAFYERQMLDAKMSQEKRKETSEWLKQLPAILGALGVAWLAYKTATINANKQDKRD
jgi:hypothetical protein